MSQDFQRDYLIRLPLPLAQLYQRAYNDKSAQSRHNNTFYLFEALIKLATAPAAAAYLLEIEQGGPRVAELDRLLVHLALPSLGQWVGMLRALAKHFGTRPDAAAHPMGHLWGQLNAPHRDRPGLLALFRRIKNGLDGEPAGDQSCTLMQVIDALVPYRNAVFGHGAGRFESFYEQEMGPLLFPAANEILAEGMLDILGPRGSRLVHLAELRMLDEERVEVGLRELVGKDSARTAPLILSRSQAATLVPDQVAVVWPGRPVPLRLDPLLVYREREMGDEILFLNRDRNGRQVEYLSYTRGEPERDRATAPALAALLGRVTGRAVGADQLEALAQQSVSETSSIEALFGPPPVPARALGDYEILAEIGRGGMGVVYLARQLSLGRLVALKMLPADLAGDEAALARFRREMRLLARCDHPNIIKVLASGTLPDGRVYYAMEYVPGCDLEQVWRELSGAPGQGDASSLGGSTWARAVLSASRKKRAGMNPRPAPASDADPAPVEEPLPSLPLPPLPELPSAEDDPGGYARRVAALVRDAALALQAIHDQQVVHRDVKPANLMLTPDGARVVLMDFGLAKGQSLSLTASKAGGLLGTLRYAAPEQLAAASLKVGPVADVRGLGVTFWELLTRRRLFAEAEDERQLAALVHDRDVPRLRTIDPSHDRDLEAIVARATERSVSDRIATAGQLSEYLQLYLDRKTLPIRAPTTAEMVGRWVRTHKPLIASIGTAGAAILVAMATASYIVYDSHLQATRRRAEAQGRVDSLLTAKVRSIPSIVELLGTDRRLVRDRLERLASGGGASENGPHLAAILTLLPDNSALADVLTENLVRPEATPDEILVISDALIRHHQTHRAESRLLSKLKNGTSDLTDEQLRAAGGLSRMTSSDPNWQVLAGSLARKLVRENPLYLGAWREVFQPIAGELADPLRRVYADFSAPQLRDRAFALLFEFAIQPQNKRQPEDLAALIGDAEADQFRRIVDLLNNSANRVRAVAFLMARIKKPARSDPSLARIQSHIALALMRLGHAPSIWPLFGHNDVNEDAGLRTELIHDILPLGFDSVPIVERLRRGEPDVLARRTLILCLGEFPPERVSESTRNHLTSQLLEWYRADPDPGVHGAVEWLLRQWGYAVALRQIDAELAIQGPRDNRNWYVNRQGQTFAIVRKPGTVLMGSPADEGDRDNDEFQYLVKIPRSFAISTREVTVAEVQRVDQELKKAGKPRLIFPNWEDEVQTYLDLKSPAEYPAVSIEWLNAARYCNMLSEAEGIPPEEWCYPKDFNPDLAKPPNYYKVLPSELILSVEDLKRKGYRLPTEAEWEYACRAGVPDSRPFGKLDSRLSNYAWFQNNAENKLHPIGLLKPNDLGLFDMLGNAWEWVQDPYGRHHLGDVDPAILERDKQVFIQDGEKNEAERPPYDIQYIRKGGGFQERAKGVRPARRSSWLDHRFDIGFRLARTL